MRVISAQTQAAWVSGDYTGPQRAMARATIQKMSIKLFPYDLKKNQVINLVTADRSGKFASAPFNQKHVPMELPNLTHISINRDVEQPVATCTMTFSNTEPLPLGETPVDPDSFDQPGYFTFNRGASDFTTRWGYAENGWQGLLVPDRLIRTYAGYGFDPDVGPEDDVHMYPSGVWLIDEVQYTASGQITVTCRDLAKLLVEHICFPPVVPWAEYPLTWTRFHNVANPKVTVATSTWIRPKWRTDSNIPYVGTGITDAGHTYVSSNGSVNGHHGKDAFDGSTSTYWLSVGNRPDWSSAFEYVEGSLASKTVSAVKVNVFGGPYHGYVSVYKNGAWQGAKRIPYAARVIDTNADIPFVSQFNVSKGAVQTIKLPKTYTGVTRVRITLNHLWNSGTGYNYRYRGAIQDVQVNAAATRQVDGGVHPEGNYGDYTDIVKWFCSWGGLYWPKDGYLTQTDGTKQVLAPATQDSIFPNPPGGRVWGDFMSTGTSGPEALGIDVWDKKPLLDCITYIRDIVSYTFFIDETGGVIWRQPNIWSIGNYVTPLTGGPHTSRVTTAVDLDERVTLLDITTKLSSRNMRERVFVGSITGGYGAVAAGFNPYPSGMRRVTGWTDQRFKNTAECRKMADLIAIRQMFTFRESQTQIAANPAIQIDDQVRIYERVTNEGYYHYVRGLQEEWDLATGEWTYDLTTHWLGERAFDKWAFDPAELSEELQEYLFEMGLIAGVVTNTTYETDLHFSGGIELGTIPLSPHYRIYKIKTNAPAWCRIYKTQATANADTAMTSTSTNVLVNAKMPATALRQDYTSAPKNGTFATANIPIRVKNRSGTRRRIRITVTAMRLP